MIQYVDNISAEEYMELRRKVGWCEFPLEEAQAGIDNAYMVKCVRNNAKAIGVVRLLWDGGYIAFLSDVIVDPKYQGQGECLLRPVLIELKQMLSQAIR